MMPRVVVLTFLSPLVAGWFQDLFLVGRMAAMAGERLGGGRGGGMTGLAAD